MHGTATTSNPMIRLWIQTAQIHQNNSGRREIRLHLECPVQEFSDLLETSIWPVIKIDNSPAPYGTWGANRVSYDGSPRQTTECYIILSDLQFYRLLWHAVKATPPPALADLPFADMLELISVFFQEETAREAVANLFAEIVIKRLRSGNFLPPLNEILRLAGYVSSEYVEELLQPYLSQFNTLESIINNRGMGVVPGGYVSSSGKNFSVLLRLALPHLPITECERLSAFDRAAFFDMTGQQREVRTRDEVLGVHPRLAFFDKMFLFILQRLGDRAQWREAEIAFICVYLEWRAPIALREREQQNRNAPPSGMDAVELSAYGLSGIASYIGDWERVNFIHTNAIYSSLLDYGVVELERCLTNMVARLKALHDQRQALLAEAFPSDGRRDVSNIILSYATRFGLTDIVRDEKLIADASTDAKGNTARQAAVVRSILRDANAYTLVPTAGKLQIRFDLGDSEDFTSFVEQAIRSRISRAATAGGSEIEVVRNERHILIFPSQFRRLWNALERAAIPPYIEVMLAQLERPSTHPIVNTGGMGIGLANSSTSTSTSRSASDAVYTAPSAGAAHAAYNARLAASAAAAAPVHNR